MTNGPILTARSMPKGNWTLRAWDDVWFSTGCCRMPSCAPALAGRCRQPTLWLRNSAAPIGFSRSRNSICAQSLCGNISCIDCTRRGVASCVWAITMDSRTWYHTYCVKELPYRRRVSWSLIYHSGLALTARLLPCGSRSGTRMNRGDGLRTFVENEETRSLTPGAGFVELTSCRGPSGFKTRTIRPSSVRQDESWGLAWSNWQRLDEPGSLPPLVWWAQRQRGQRVSPGWNAFRRLPDP